MRSQLFVSACLLAASITPAQTAPTAPAAQKELFFMPSDPRAIIAAARPLYDFADPALKPWHLKASYQLYEADGKPGAQGTFEYWWAAPDIHRTLWKCGSMTYSDWSLGAGRFASRGTDGLRTYAESKLFAALLDPLPEEKTLDSKDARVERREIPFDGKNLPCVMVGPKINIPVDDSTEPIGLFPTFCFDQHLPALLTSFSLGSTTIAFSRFAKVQGKLLSQDITILIGKEKLLTAKVEEVAGIKHDDPALAAPADVPVADSAPLTRVGVAGGVAVGLLIKKLVPVYPAAAKAAHISGTVVIDALIGTDGQVHEPRVVSAPSPSLAASALDAVSKWEYRPFLLNGSPIEIRTTVNVVYSLSF